MILVGGFYIDGRMVMSLEGHCSLMLKVKGRKGGRKELGRNRLRKKA